MTSEAAMVWQIHDRLSLGRDEADAALRLTPTQAS